MLLDPRFEVVAIVGRRSNSPGLQMFESRVKYLITDGIIGLIPFLDEIDGAFDATSAFNHLRHWEVLANSQKWVIDLTPSKLGKVMVPVLIDKVSSMTLQSVSASNYSMVTCGGQSSAPLIYAITRASSNIREVEVSSSIAALSAGPATRRNIDEYIESTENLASQISGCKNVKAILVLNPVDPPVMMRTTINISAEFCDLDKARALTSAIVAEVQKYVPGYETIVQPHFQSKDTISATVKVTGAGYVLPEYSGNLDIINSAAVETAYLHVSRNQIRVN
jgi:acetaldehyde dehydrogenase